MMKTKYTYKIVQNVYEDVWNWWSACNHSSHGVVWKKQVDEKLANKLIGATKREANKILVPYLKKLYEKEENTIENATKLITDEFDKKLQKGCEKIEEIMKRPIYRQNFTIFLTTLRRGPYYKPKGYVWHCVYWNDPIEGFLHELCHFQFIHYWRENKDSEVSKLTNNQFEFLKESLTIILDKDFIPIISKSDFGYDLHQDFRKELIAFWRKEKDFDKLVGFGIREIKYFDLKTGKKK